MSGAQGLLILGIIFSFCVLPTLHAQVEIKSIATVDALWLYEPSKLTLQSLQYHLMTLHRGQTDINIAISLSEALICISLS